MGLGCKGDGRHVPDKPWATEGLWLAGRHNKAWQRQRVAAHARASATVLAHDCMSASLPLYGKRRLLG